MYRVPGASVLSTPCYEIDLTTVKEFYAPDLFTKFFGPPSPRALRRTPFNPESGLRGDPTHVPGRDPRADDAVNEDVNCFWVALARDQSWVTGLPVPARCESDPIKDEDIPPVLVGYYGGTTLDDRHGPTSVEGRARHRDGKKAIFVRDPTKHVVGHVFNARDVRGRIQYGDEQQGYDAEFRFVPGMPYFFYRTN